MKILLTNDDGIDADGLRALEAAVAAFGSLTVVAPDGARSGCGHSVRTDAPIGVREVAASRFAIDGSPADCTRLGLMHFATDADWVISGVNAGGNMGVDIHMSGTVAAAREAALQGRPALAISQYRDRGGSFDWNRAAQIAERVFRYVQDLPLLERHFWNVNLPDLNGLASEPEIVLCEPDHHPLAIAFEQRDGQFQYRGIYQERKFSPGSDIDRCFNGYVAVSSVFSGVGSSN